jgi:ubiquinone/menaquinone biosynthesis C-methylase UbiE
VLDVACGTGLSGLALHRHGFRSITGLDYCPQMLNLAREKGGLVEESCASNPECRDLH